MNKISDRLARRRALEAQPCPECARKALVAGRMTPDHGHCMRCGTPVRARVRVIGRRRRSATVLVSQLGPRPVQVVVAP